MLEIIVKYKDHQDWTIKYTEKDIFETLKIGIQSETDSATLFYGPVSQYGSFTLFDKNNFIYNHIKNNTFYSNVEEYVLVEIYLDNNLILRNKASILYDLDDRRISFDIYDSMQDWENIIYPGFRFIDIYLNSEKSSCGDGESPYEGIVGSMCKAMLTGEEIYDKLKDFTENEGEIFEELDNNTENWLNKIKVYVPVIEECSLFDAWVKFCELSLSHLYRTQTGELRLVVYD